MIKLFKKTNSVWRIAIYRTVSNIKNRKRRSNNDKLYSEFLKKRDSF